MKLFMNSGTFDYLLNLYKKHENEPVLLLRNAGKSLLLHETAGETFMKEPRSFDVFGQAGTLTQETFISMNHIPVPDEETAAFEHTFRDLGAHLQSKNGFRAYRLLRPLRSDTYIVLIAWNNENAYKDWDRSGADGFPLKQSSSKASITKKIFTGGPYTQTFHAPSLSD